ncbi:MAG TPA: histidine kinase [Bacteroidia bacterium]|nr:histidine kinase [Bacteroidia bacterium]
MLKIFFHIGVLIFISAGNIFAQLPDSVRAALNSAPHDTVRIRKLVEYARQTEGDSITIFFADSAIKLIDKNLQAGLPEKLLKGYKVDALTMIGMNSFAFTGDGTMSERASAEALSIARTLNDKQRLADAFLSFTDYYTITGDVENLWKALDTCLLMQQQVNDKKGMVHAYCNMGNYYTAIGNSDSSILSFKKGYQLALEIKNKNLEANTLYALGFASAHKGSSNEALDYLYKSVKAYEDDGRPGDAYAALMYIGTIYSQTGNYKKAISFYDKALDLVLRKKDLLTLSLLYNYKGKAYNNLSMTDSSNYYYLQAADIAKQINYRELYVTQLINIGSNYLDMGDSAKALNYLYQSIEENTDKLKENLAESYFHVGRILLGKNKIDSAMYYAGQAEKIAESLHFTATHKQVEYLLSEVYSRKGEHKKALDTYKKFIIMRDSMDNSRAYRKALEKQFEYESEKKELVAKAEQEKKDIQIKEQKDKRIISTVAFAAILALGGSLVFVNRKRKENMFRKNLAESEMKALRAQMNPHFMFNSLNAIQQMVLNNENDNAFHYLDTYSKLTRKILENSEKKWITVDDEIKFLELYLSIESLRFQHSFKYEIKVDEDVSVHTDKVPAVVVQPYVENAIKHGLLPKENNQELLISFSRNSDDALEIIVEDNGVGRKHSMELKSGNGHQSMGMTITQNRLRLLEGKKENRIFIEDLVSDKDGFPAGTRVHIIINQVEV